MSKIVIKCSPRPGIKIMFYATLKQKPLSICFHNIYSICCVCFMRLLLLWHKPQSHMETLFKKTSSRLSLQIPTQEVHHMGCPKMHGMKILWLHRMIVPWVLVLRWLQLLAHLLFILFARSLCIVCVVSFVCLFRAFVVGLYEMERQRQGRGLLSAGGGWLFGGKWSAGGFPWTLFTFHSGWTVWGVKCVWRRVNEEHRNVYVSMLLLGSKNISRGSYERGCVIPWRWNQ